MNIQVVCNFDIILWFQGPQQYVDELLEIHRKFQTLIKDTFRDDPAFISALDKVSHYYIIYEIHPNTEIWRFNSLVWQCRIHCWLYQFFFSFSCKQKRNTSIHWIIMLDLVNTWSFIRICAKHMYTTNVCQGISKILCPGIHFSVTVVKFGACHGPIHVFPWVCNKFLWMSRKRLLLFIMVDAIIKCIIVCLAM